MGKEHRRGRIFVDYLRNARGATAVVPYSLRARPGATVATPLSWDELSAKVPPSQFTIATIPARIARKDDPWADYGQRRQRLTAAMQRALGESAAARPLLTSRGLGPTFRGTMTSRTLLRAIPSVPTSDGAGVKLRRGLGQSPLARHDPFLMLDHFSTDNADDYVAGFPSHPHRGFETVTYMIEGHMRHEDHLGHVGDLRSGGVQWMTAGRGVIHSEMPQQEAGRMRGFQLWINLPATEKMKPAAYRDIPAAEIPLVALPGGGVAKVVAGTLDVAGHATAGPIQGLATAPLYVDLELPAGASVTVPVKAGHNAFLYVFEGSVEVGPADATRTVATHHAGMLSDGDEVTLTGGPAAGRLLLLAGRPLREPVVQWGPFVMNTREEIEQAIRDYQSGRLTDAAA